MTKFVKLISVSIGEGALSAPDVALLFFEHVVQLFGIPPVVLHDHDARFTTNFGAVCGNCWVLGLHYHQPTIHS